MGRTIIGTVATDDPWTLLLRSRDFWEDQMWKTVSTAFGTLGFRNYTRNTHTHTHTDTNYTGSVLG